MRRRLNWVGLVPLGLIGALLIGVYIAVGQGYLDARRIPPSTGGPAAPIYIRVPSVAIGADVLPLDLRGEVLDAPADPTEAGWWRGSALPGSTRGNVVITAHKLNHGGGAFDTLAQVERGELIAVDTQAGTQNYRVDSGRYYTREELAAASADLFGGGGEPRLVVVTCEDWDGQAWRGNYVVTGRQSAA